MKLNRRPGRRPLEEGVESVVVQTRVTPQQRDKLAALGGADWIRDRIDRARLPIIRRPK